MDSLVTANHSIADSGQRVCAAERREMVTAELHSALRNVEVNLWSTVFETSR